MYGQIRHRMPHLCPCESFSIDAGSAWITLITYAALQLEQMELDTDALRVWVGVARNA